jgi:hypothetical protein
MPQRRKPDWGILLLMLSQESKKSEWLSKKRQMQGAQLSRNEAYSGTPQ